EIAQKCNLEMEFGVFKMPHYTPPQGTTNEDFLRKLCDQGLKKRYGKPSEEQLKRVDFELSVIKQMGFISYFLIVWDVIRFAKENNIPMGPGRGSATGSLVCYALEIVNIDPLKYDLMFERFLNPDRVNMPDIDIDFCYERRDEVINYVRRKYGQDNVAQIITFGTMAAKGVIRDVGRARGMPYNDVDRIAKLIPNELNITLADAIKKEPELKHLYENDEQITSLITTSLALEGLNRHASTHAAGVVISEDNLTNHTPLCKTSDGQISTQYAMSSLEMIGLLKMDFLGLKTLTVIDKTMEKVSRTKNEKIDIENISLEDKKTYELFRDAQTIGVFQLESSGMRDLLKKMQPTEFEDLIALLALYRPGPLGSGMVDDYIKWKHNPKLVKYDHPKLEPVLKDTHGIILYQEQVMRIASHLANMTLGQADILRRAMGKKTPEVMEQQRKVFVEGAHKNGISRKIAEKIFEKVEYFAGYGFNKSHSAAYALISYQTAYLKANYPVEFMSSQLTSEKDRTDKIVLYIEEARNMNIPVLPPDVNESYSEFTVVGDSIRFGLSAVKNVGLGAIASIVETRKSQNAFKSLYDFCEHVDLRTVNRKVLESLIKCGAFDNLKAKRSQMIAVLDRAVEMGQSLQKDKQSGQMSFFDDFEKQDKFRQEVHEFPDMKEWPENQLLAFEKELLGFYVTGHPLTKYEKILNTYMTCPATGMVEIEDGSEVMTGGIINKLRTTFTKRGEKMAFFTLEDLSGVIEVAALPDTYRDAASIIALDSMILVRGRLERREEEPKIRAREIIPLDQARAKYTAAIEIVISTSGLEEDMLKSLNRIFQSNQGSVPAYLRFRTSKNKTYRMLVDSIKGINPTDKFSTDIEKLLGKDSLKFFKNNKK
ncbi:MAG: DNA polymerase III subunit alpha, partial [Candidatus Omnitrophica bacterium]|nr:DNA polymerase III subunit alpha [Candidatus Omnitrophota bacterium]